MPIKETLIVLFVQISDNFWIPIYSYPLKTVR
jgi:hypothetical protein